jgi:hypothetical protein
MKGQEGGQAASCLGQAARPRRAEAGVRGHAIPARLHLQMASTRARRHTGIRKRREPRDRSLAWCVERQLKFGLRERSEKPS